MLAFIVTDALAPSKHSSRNLSKPRLRMPKPKDGNSRFEKMNSLIQSRLGEEPPPATVKSERDFDMMLRTCHTVFVEATEIAFVRTRLPPVNPALTPLGNAAAGRLSTRVKALNRLRQALREDWVPPTDAQIKESRNALVKAMRKEIRTSAQVNVDAANRKAYKQALDGGPIKH